MVSVWLSCVHIASTADGKSSLAFYASESGDTDTLQQESTPDETVAHIRLAHLAPGLATTDLYLNDVPVMRRLTLGEITEWRGYPPGNFRLSLSASDSSPSLADFDVQAGDWVTLALVDSDEGGGGGGSARVILEDYRAKAESARVTFVQALNDNITMNVLVDGKVLLQAAPLSDSDGVATAEISVGNHEIAIVNSAATDTRLGEPAQRDFAAMSNTFIAIYGTLDAPEMVVQTAMMPASTEDTPLPNSAAQALLRVLHISSGTPPLDIYVDGQVQTTAVGGDGDTADLRFPEMSGWMVLSAGTSEIIITESGESRDTPLLPALTLNLKQDSTTTLAIIGAAANDTLQVWPLQEDFSDVTTGSVRVGLFNAHPGSGPVNVQLDDGTVLASQLGYPGFFGDNDGFIETIVDEGAYDASIIQSTDETALVTFPVDLRSGRNYFLAIISANPPYYLTFSDLAETQELLTPVR